MATLVQVREKRVKLLRAFRRKQRTLDTKIEILERTLGRMIERKRKIPDQGDLLIITNQTDAVVNATNDLVAANVWLAAGFAL
ncbi:hypothetical protein ES708_27973 [subsurface metagenome]